MTKRTTQQEVQIGPPAWVRELVEKYESGLAHAFVITGNIQDYVGGVPGQTLHSYLASAFGRREVVAFYNRSSGFSFPGGLPSNLKANRERSETMRQKFAQITGLASAGGDGRVSITQARLSSVPRGASTQAGALDEIKLEQIARQPGLALQKLGQVLHYRPTASAEQPEWAGTAVVLDYAETLAPASDGPLSPEDRSCYISLSEWGRDLSIAESGGIVILIVSDLSLLHEQLRKSGSRWEQIEIPFPTFAERVAFLRHLIREREIPLAAGLDPQDIARLTPGLRFIDLEDCALRALYQNQPLSLDLVRQRKDEIIAGEFHDVLAVVDSDQGFESLGGLGTVKEILRDYVIAPMRQGHKRVVPQGMLWMGPPGTGKTRLALALAAEAKVAFVELQPARIFSKFVGASERNLERALQAIKAMTPCIVFIDELDQLGSRGDEGDSGVSKRIFKRLMEVMADGRLRGEVLWIGCTNRPDRLDAALRRPGRLDEAIPILPPDEQERVEILALLSRQGFQSLSKQVVLPEQEWYQALAAQTQGYTSAELELLVGQAIKLWVKSSQELEIADALQRAVQLIIPATEDVELMTELALRFCNNLAFVPESYREQARLLRQRRERQAVPQEQEEDAKHSGRQARRF